MTAATRVIGPARLLGEVEGPMPEVTRAAYQELVAAVGLRGRGGAGFPVSVKLADLPADGSSAVVVNGSESEPISRKDRLLMTVAPHLVLDGAIGIAKALRAPLVIVSVHDSAAAAAIRGAAAGRRRDGLEIRVDESSGRFVAGEARAVLRGLEGDKAVPPGRRTLPSRKGYQGRPTFLSNVETFAQIAVLARLGAREYARTGLAAEPGTQLLTIAGDVERPGVIEVPTGVPLDTILAASGAAKGSTTLLGGYHGIWLPRTEGVLLSRTVKEVPLGAGIVLALGPDTCPLGEVHRVAQWLADQSARQCGPCVFGLGAIVDDFGRLLAGDPNGWHDARRHLGLVDGRGACAHPDGAARFLASALDAFGDAVRDHLGTGCGRPVRGVLPLDDHGATK